MRNKEQNIAIAKDYLKHMKRNTDIEKLTGHYAARDEPSESDDIR